jgi:hypothetical protein
MSNHDGALKSLIRKLIGEPHAKHSSGDYAIN